MAIEKQLSIKLQCDGAGLDPGPTVAHITNAPASTPGLVECTLMPGKETWRHSYQRELMGEGNCVGKEVCSDTFTAKAGAVGRKGSYVSVQMRTEVRMGAKLLMSTRLPWG